MIYRLAFVFTSLLVIGTFDVFAQTSAGFGFPTLPPCGEGQTSQICRVTGTWDAAELIQRYEQEGSSLWGDEADETLTFFYQGDADQVVLCCGIQDSMFHVSDSDVWVRKIRVPDLAQAVISYSFMPYKDDQVTMLTMPMPNIWRGSEAPPEAEQSDPLRGEIRTAPIESEALDETRDLTIYLPPGYDPEQTYRVIYMADGQSVPQFAPFLEPLIAAGDLPPIIIVGVHSAMGSPGHDVRAEEYIPSMKPDRFEAHERFFTEEVRRYAETEFGAAAGRDERIVFGYSNGGVFAAAIGLRHPELYGHILAFSPGVLAGSPREDSDLVADYYLVSGTLESSFYRNTLTLRNTLENLGAVTEFKGRVAGHDQIMWQEEFPGAVRWAFT